MLLVILKTKKLLERFTEKNCKRQKELKKVIKGESDQLYVKWKGYDSSFSSWIDKKRLSINNSLIDRKRRSINE